MYKKPVVLRGAELFEGVYAASGAVADGSDCYTTTARIHQTPETGRGDYRIQVDAHHGADHNSNAQILHISFNQPVTYKSCNANGANYISGNGTNTILVGMSYWNNHTDNIGFGDLIVESDPGLAVTNVFVEDTGKC